MSFQIGDKVVAIKVEKNNLDAIGISFNKDYYYIGTYPAIDTVYVINKIIPHLNCVGLSLIGSTCVHKHTCIEVGWHEIAFRKLDDIKKNIKNEHSMSSGV